MIQLVDGLVMTADENQYVIGKPNKARCNGVQGACKANVLSNPRYYPTAALAVQGALKIVLRRGVADGSITTLRQFIQEQDRLRAELEKLVAPLDGGPGA